MNLKKKMLALQLFLLNLPMTVYASYNDDGKDLINQALDGKDATTEDTLSSVVDTLTTVLGFIRTAGIVIAILMLIYCAIQLASSAGNQQKRAMAMEGIKNVLIATAIIGGAALISQLALGILGK